MTIYRFEVEVEPGRKIPVTIATSRRKRGSKHWPGDLRSRVIDEHLPPRNSDTTIAHMSTEGVGRGGEKSPPPRQREESTQ